MSGHLLNSVLHQLTYLQNEMKLNNGNNNNNYNYNNNNNNNNNDPCPLSCRPLAPSPSISPLPLLPPATLLTADWNQSAPGPMWAQIRSRFGFPASCYQDGHQRALYTRDSLCDPGVHAHALYVGALALLAPSRRPSTA